MRVCRAARLHRAGTTPATLSCETANIPCGRPVEGVLMLPIPRPRFPGSRAEERFAARISGGSACAAPESPRSSPSILGSRCDGRPLARRSRGRSGTFPWVHPVIMNRNASTYDGPCPVYVTESPFDSPEFRRMRPQWTRECFAGCPVCHVFASARGRNRRHGCRHGVCSTGVERLDRLCVAVRPARRFTPAEGPPRAEGDRECPNSPPSRS